MVQPLENSPDELNLVDQADRSAYYRAIGQRIRQLRHGQKVTLRWLALRANLTAAQISQVELGKNAASVWALARIARALGVGLAELLSGL